MYLKLGKCCVRRGINALFTCGKYRIQPLSTHFTNLSSNKKESDLSSSTLLFEDGHNMQELPVIVRRMKDLIVVYEDMPSKISPKNPDSTKFESIQKEFQECVNLRDIYTLLCKCTKITPNIAIGALWRISHLEENKLSSPLSEEINLVDASRRDAFVEKLLNAVFESDEADPLILALNIDSSLLNEHKYKFCDEILVRVTDNLLSIQQLCDFIQYLSKNKKDLQLALMIDKLWIGFNARQSEINEMNIVSVYSIVPALKQSKKMILNLLENKLCVVWWKLKPSALLVILDILSKEKYISHRSLAVTGRWLNTNFHMMNDDLLLEIISKFTQMQYNDPQIEKAVERYIKVKGVKIESQMLLIGILNYCMTFRLRNTNILRGCSEYFASRGLSMPVNFLGCFIHPFGYLYFHPTNGPVFWEAVEKVLNQKMSSMSPESILDIFISCIYLGKYPLKFTDRVFNPNFMEIVSSHEDPERLRSKLKLIDTALAIECPYYEGPMLPKDQIDKVVYQDSRIKRIVNNIRESLEGIAGGSDKVSTSILLPNLFAHELYVLDIMFHPSRLGSSILNLKLESDKNVNVAVLVHLPEHFCHNSNQLIGPQVMRTKHLRLLGLKVASLKYNTLVKLKVHTAELEKYIKECLKNAEHCL